MYSLSNNRDNKINLHLYWPMAVVQALLILGEETWVLTEMMMQKTRGGTHEFLEAGGGDVGA